MTVRDEAHRLLDEIPSDRLDDAVHLLRELGAGASATPRRVFRTTAIFDGDPDTASQAKKTVRAHWDSRRSA